MCRGGVREGGGGGRSRNMMPVENLHRRLRVGVVGGLEPDLMQTEFLKEGLLRPASVPLTCARGAGEGRRADRAPGSCPSGLPEPDSCPPPVPQSADSHHNMPPVIHRAGPADVHTVHGQRARSAPKKRAASANLVELGEVGGVERLVTEHAVNGEVLFRLELVPARRRGIYLMNPLLSNIFGNLQAKTFLFQSKVREMRLSSAAKVKEDKIKGENF